MKIWTYIKHADYGYNLHNKGNRKTMKSTQLFILILASIPCYAQMQIYEFGVKNFAYEMQTEAHVYKLLKQYPLNADVAYVAVPWAYLRDHNGVRAVTNIHVENGFTVCQHIHFKEIIPQMKECGVTVLFTPHADRDEYKGVKLVPLPHYPINGVEPNPIKDIYYSFVGYDTHESRTKIFKRITHPENTVIIKRTKYHYWQPVASDKENEVEYKDILSRSRFSLCPRGTGPSTIRFWESLQAGAIPIVISDAMHYPEGFDWDSCVIKVPEKHVGLMFEKLAKITPEQEEQMRQNCLKAFDFFCRGSNFLNAIRMYYEKN